MLPFPRFPGADSMLGPEMKLDRRGDGHRRRLPDRLRQGPGRRRGRAAARGHGLHHRHRPPTSRRATQLAATLHDLGFKLIATGGHRAGDLAGWASRSSRSTRSPRARRQRRRLDRARRRAPGDQHAERQRRAQRRLRDPRRRDRTGNPLHHDDDRRQRRRPGDRRDAHRITPTVRSLQELHGLSAGSAQGAPA